jgi:hypothetical protein
MGLSVAASLVNAGNLRALIKRSTRILGCNHELSVVVGINLAF